MTCVRERTCGVADFFTVEVLTMGGLVRYFVFFVMRLKTRTVEIAGITCQPNETWMTQIARKLTDAQDGFLRGVRSLILDRDPLYTTAFRRMLRDSGVKPLLLPARSPNLNAYAERFVLSAKSEAWNASSLSARSTSELPFESSWTITMMNARTRASATSSSRPRQRCSEQAP
jgi:transposase InsO family protein